MSVVISDEILHAARMSEGELKQYHKLPLLRDALPGLSGDFQIVAN
jgi:hypothetical protein